ncbi:MAG: M12 family metallo-peptidase [Pontiella sp.]
MRKKTVALIIFALLFIGFSVFRTITPYKGGVQSFSNKISADTVATVKTSDSISTAEPKLSLAVTKHELLEVFPEEQAEWHRETPAALRVGVVVPDPILLQTDSPMEVGDRISLRFFDDVFFDAELINITAYPNKGVGLTARLTGSGHGVVHMAYSGGELRISTEVHGQNDFYVRFDPETGRHLAIEVDRAASDIKSCPSCNAFADPLKSVESQISTSSTSADAQSAPSVDGPTVATMDLLIVYTTAAKNYEGGVNGINNNINVAMQKANTAHGNSDTRVIINLMHSEEVSYVENQGDMEDDLEKLTFIGGSNSELDHIHSLRETYKADFVSLFALSTSSGGIAWLLNDTGGDEDRAFNVNRVQQTDFTYTMVHEIGHNMGCGHSATQWTQQGPGVYSYSSGWQWGDAGSPPTTIGYCSVMTYEDFDGVGSNKYVQVGHFSNPSIQYSGINTGNSGQGDNARTIRSLRFTYENYRIGNPDQDGDGMADEWEDEFLGGTNALATADLDDDGMNNISEYIAGTLPNNAASIFEVTSHSAPVSNSAPFIVTWNAVAGRVYDVKWTENLIFNSFTNISGYLPYPANSYTDLVERTSLQNLYRVDVKLDQ